MSQYVYRGLFASKCNAVSKAFYMLEVIRCFFIPVAYNLCVWIYYMWRITTSDTLGEFYIYEHNTQGILFCIDVNICTTK